MKCFTGNSNETVKATEENHKTPTNKAINMTNNQHESERLYVVFHKMPNLPDQNQSQRLPSV